MTKTIKGYWFGCKKRDKFFSPSYRSDDYFKLGEWHKKPKDAYYNSPPICCTDKGYHASKTLEDAVNCRNWGDHNVLCIVESSGRFDFDSNKYASTKRRIIAYVVLNQRSLDTIFDKYGFNGWELKLEEYCNKLLKKKYGKTLAKEFKLK
jgi:hypothetical protein